MGVETQPPFDSATRNSFARRLTYAPRVFVARTLAERGFTGNEIAAVRLLGVIKKSVEMVVKGDEQGLLDRADDATELTGYLLLDGVDGEAERQKQLLFPRPVKVYERKKRIGGVVDALTDRFQEIMLAMARAVNAHKKGDLSGEMAAYASAITAGMPSAARAHAEKKGNVVTEDGSRKGASKVENLLRKAGTYQGRATLDVAKVVLPKARKYIDAFQAGTSLLITYERYKAAYAETAEKPTEKEQDEAELREKVLIFSNVLAAGASVATFTTLRRGR